MLVYAHVEYMATYELDKASMVSEYNVTYVLQCRLYSGVLVSLDYRPRSFDIAIYPSEIFAMSPGQAPLTQYTCNYI